VISVMIEQSDPSSLVLLGVMALRNAFFITGARP
jgi:hypothetical protein